jgi:hypothetical protein
MSHLRPEALLLAVEMQLFAGWERPLYRGCS